MSVFKRAIPSVAVTRSSFGGGWAWALNAAGEQALREFYNGEDPAEIPVLATYGQRGFAKGYIVEPHESEDLAEHLRSCNLEWEIR